MTSSSKPVVLVAGASGVVGTAAVEAFLGADFEVVALSRRAPVVDSTRPYRHLSVDLRDAAACASAVADLPTVTHVVYAAVAEQPGLVAGWRDREQMALNLAMLRHVLDPLCERGGVRHVSLLQGTKAYGAHLHRIPVPARERFPRDPHDNFYWLHEDHVRALAARHGLTFTIWRPQLIVGPNHGVVMNLPPIIGAYAAICREEGLPFAFPGGASRVWEAVDTRLLAAAMVWAASSPAAVDETFNITNGEVFEWRSLWPALADELGLEVGPDQPRSLADYLPAKADVWDRVVARHGLQPSPMAELLGESHHYADLCFNSGRATPGPPALVSTVKLRQAGFGECCDTEASFRHWLRVLVERKVLPPPGPG
jgi:nucleoside-diphosphate-sugar epimerase